MGLCGMMDLGSSPLLMIEMVIVSGFPKVPESVKDFLEGMIICGSWYNDR
jgi:hypothetical protein